MEFHLQLSDQLFDLTRYMNQGGYVMYPLVGVSIWMWYLIIKKLTLLYLWKKDQKTDFKKIKTIISEFNLKKTDDNKINNKLLLSLVKRDQDQLDQHIKTIFVLSAIAPLLGLLGTVTGMISTFDAIYQFGTTNARALAKGISEALITTQTGLVIAVPGLIMGNFIQRRVNNIQTRLDRFFLNTAQRIAKGDNNFE